MADQLTKDQFELAYRRAMDEGGHSYDPWDIKAAWGLYQRDPGTYEWVLPFVSRG